MTNIKNSCIESIRNAIIEYRYNADSRERLLHRLWMIKISLKEKPFWDLL